LIAKALLQEYNGGRALAFISRIDNKGPGAHQVREDRKLYNTDAEK